jgi:hypothetical protein
MDQYFGAAEMLFSFSLILGFLLWQLYSVNRAKRRRIERERAEGDAP